MKYMKNWIDIKEQQPKPGQVVIIKAILPQIGNEPSKEVVEIVKWTGDILKLKTSFGSMFNECISHWRKIE